MSGARLDRSQPPSAGRIRPFDFPDVTADRLESGLELRVSQLGRLPLATVTLVLDAGESVLDGDRAGLAVLTGDALEGGTTRRKGVDLAEALEGIGATLSIGTGWEATTVSLSCMADRLQEGVGLLAETTLEPAFPESEIERLKAQRLAALQQRRMDPASLASDRARRLIYREGVPYGRPLPGTTESIETIGRDAAVGFAEARYRPRGTGFVAVGDLDPGELRALADRYFGSWSGDVIPASSLSVAPRSLEREIVVVDRPQSVQSEIRIGHVGVSKSSPDYFALQVLNTILGGSFTSRLNLNLREKNGFTYGVRSRFSFRRWAGPFSISTAVATEVTADAVREAMSELDGLLDGGPTQEEVDAAKDYIAGVFPLRLETTGQIASRIAEIIVYDLPDDYHSRYRDEIRSVTRDHADAAGRRHIRPGEATIVVVGDAAAVRGPLEELQLGPVRVEDAP